MKQLSLIILIVTTFLTLNSQSHAQTLIGSITPTAKVFNQGDISCLYMIGKIDELTTANNTNQNSDNQQTTLSENITSKDLTITAYPNPFVENITIKIPALKNSVSNSVQLIDVSGRTITPHYTVDTENGEIKIAAANIAKGNYIIRIISNIGIFSTNVIKI